MSFFNGYSAYANTSQGPTSPTRTGLWGSSYSPFRSTTLPIPDITMSQTLPCLNSTRSRSPGKVSPSGNGSGVTGGCSGITGSAGRTMKDYEEQLGRLGKENFNLKLRVYFLEERMGITSADEDSIKKNIELKVEVESLKKELVEKQELLSQAAKAFELIEQQKEASSRDQVQYQQSLDVERRRIAQLEKELEEFKEQTVENSAYYKEAFNISAEKSHESKEQLEQMEKLVTALAAEVKQITASLEEERSWGMELESERDQLKERLESEIELRNNLTTEKDKDIEELREKIKQLEEQVFKLENSNQSQKRELGEKERMIRDKITLLEDKCRALAELSTICDKRKKQIDSLRNSVKARDDALTELNNKHRALLVQFEDNHPNQRSLSPSSSPATLRSIDNLHAATWGQKSSPIHPLSTLSTSPVDWEAKRPTSVTPELRLQTHIPWPSKDITKELEERDRELKVQEEAKKQLTLKLCNVQKSAAVTDHRVKKLEEEKEKAVKMIQGFMERQEQLEDKNLKKDRRIMELEVELSRLRDQDMTTADCRYLSVRRNLSNEISDDPERDNSNQQRFEEMKSKIKDLSDQMETIKAEKNELELRIQLKSEELLEQLRHREKEISQLQSERDNLREKLSNQYSWSQSTEDFQTSGRASTRCIEQSQTQNGPVEDPALINAVKTIKSLESQRDKLRQKLFDKELREDLKMCCRTSVGVSTICDEESQDQNNLAEELAVKNAEIEIKDKQIDQLTKELNIRTQNLQKLVNTELWSKNKEIAKLHNHMTASNGLGRSRNKSEGSIDSSIAQLSAVIKELGDIGIQVKFVDDTVQLTCANNGKIIDVKETCNYVAGLIEHKNELEKEVDYLKWLKLISKPATDELENSGSEAERAKKYCGLLRMHLKELVKFMKDVLLRTDFSDTIAKEHQKLVLDIFLESQILPNELFSCALNPTNERNLCCLEARRSDRSIEKSRSDHHLDANNRGSPRSDSEAFSEPDRTVSLARIGLREPPPKFTRKPRLSKYRQTFSDLEESGEYRPYFIKTYRDPEYVDISLRIQQFKKINANLYLQLEDLSKEIPQQFPFMDGFNQLIMPLIRDLKKSDDICESLQAVLENKMQECRVLKSERKRNNSWKSHSEKKHKELEYMIGELTKEKAELSQAKENVDRKAAEVLTALSRENEMLRVRIKQMEQDIDITETRLTTMRIDMDQLTLAHSQILVENTKLAKEKSRLEQDMRKADTEYENSMQLLHEKFDKEITDLNQVIDAHRARLQELENVNKELSRQIVVCETSDSAPSSSGISSIPTDIILKQGSDDAMHGYQSRNGSQFWLSMNYPTFTGRSKSSCSPDLGIESDAALTATRPLKDTLKITESMTNLLSEDENCNTNGKIRDLDNESPLPMEGLNEMEALQQENEALKRRLMRTRRALEDTFQHLSASNKTKKNVEKAITKQLMITKSILKKTRTYEESFDT